MSLLLAIDPGPTESAWVVYNELAGTPVRWRKSPNDSVLATLHEPPFPCGALAIEMVASYGMAVGATVFETCVWAGRFIQLWQMTHHSEATRVYRREVKMHLCGSMRAKDANIRQALIDRYGPGKETAIGKKATPGPLYGMSGDCWAALGVAVTAVETSTVSSVAA